jgi:hypothetical protein
MGHLFLQDKQGSSLSMSFPARLSQASFQAVSATQSVEWCGIRLHEKVARSLSVDVVQRRFPDKTVGSRLLDLNLRTRGRKVGGSWSKRCFLFLETPLVVAATSWNRFFVL